jgi:hypothetical protein
MLEHLQDGAELPRIALTQEFLTRYLADHPIGGRAFDANRRHGSSFQNRAGQVDRDQPTGRVQSLDGHAFAVLPGAVAAGMIPGLQEFERHRVNAKSVRVN